MTLFGLYRILDFRGRLSLSTIIDPGINLDKFLPNWDNFIKETFVPLLRQTVKLGEMEKPEVYPILKSSPTSSYEVGSVSTSSVDIKGSAWLWEKSSFRPSFSRLVYQLGASGISERIRLLGSAFSRNPTFNPTHLGKLGFKLEPAGKVRVFAMVDAWTQWTLRPLHKWLFACLKQLSFVDGTFDQKAPVFRLQSMFADYAKGRSFASIDLSAATDRLPISLQVSVLRHLLRGVVPDSDTFAECWKSILVERTYKVSPGNDILKGCDIPATLPRDVLYAVGQPMGALSSWAMLAMTHHAIVQFAAYRAGFRYWFDRYAILGDDIVIADGEVAYHYRLVLQEIGVKAGLAKSILARSRFVVEFAKSFFVDRDIASALPLKECIATRTSTALVVEFVRKYELPINSILAFLGYGYRSRSKAYSNELFKLGTRMRVLLVWLAHPGSWIGFTRWSEWLFMRSWNTLHNPRKEVIIKVLRIIDSLADKKALRIDNAVKRYFQSLEDTVSMLDRESPLLLPSQYLIDPALKEKLPWSSFLHPESTYRTLDSFIVDKPVPWWGRFIWERGFFSFYEWVKVHYFSDESAELDKSVEPRFELDRDLADYYLDFSRKLHSGSQGITSGDPRISMDPEGNVLVTSMSFHELMEVVDDRLEWLFNYDPLSTILPPTFWQQERSPEPRFKDFLTIYKLWQEISRPAWSDYYSQKSRSVALGPNDGVGCLSVTLYTKIHMPLIKWRLIKDQLLTPAVIYVNPVWWKHLIDRTKSIFIYYENRFVNNRVSQPLSEIVLFVLLLYWIGTTEVWGYESPYYLVPDIISDSGNMDLTYIYNFIYWLGAVSLVLVAGITLATIRNLENQVMTLEDEVIFRTTEVMIRSTRIIEQNSTIADLVSSLEIATLYSNF
jgi:hypothetical protein